MPRRLVRIAVIAAAAALTAGCFQPLYGELPGVGAVNGPALRDALASVDVAQIPAPNGTPEARLAVEVRNGLLFDLTGGGAAAPPTHRLNIRLTTTRLSVVVDINTARPDAENYGIDATYTLVDLATNKPVFTSAAFSRVSYDVPGQEQRFARARALRDAENRAAKVLAEQIKSRLASYFATRA